MAVKYNLEDLKDLYIPDWKAVTVYVNRNTSSVILFNGDVAIYAYKYNTSETLKVALKKFKKFILERQKEQAIERAKIEAAARKNLKK